MDIPNIRIDKFFPVMHTCYSNDTGLLLGVTQNAVLMKLQQTVGQPLPGVCACGRTTAHHDLDH